jgi:prolipoprotein diacylglyceryltransferase
MGTYTKMMIRPTVCFVITEYVLATRMIQVVLQPGNVRGCFFLLYSIYRYSVEV